MFPLDVAVFPLDVEMCTVEYEMFPLDDEMFLFEDEMCTVDGENQAHPVENNHQENSLPVIYISRGKRKAEDYFQYNADGTTTKTSYNRNNRRYRLI